MSNPVSIEFSNTWPSVIPEVNFDECPEETLEVRLRSTETQSTNNTCSRGGRRD